jgi:LmbE family N-acetylglucosaminyl deacetylase
MNSRKRAFAVAAHPDDVEFLMSGTLMRLGRAGYDLHIMTIANGSCGSMTLEPEAIARVREEEARTAARSIGATYHPGLVDDLAIFYERPLLARVAAVMRDVAPEILLVPSPQDYMEDHQNAARLAVTAAFARGMSNFPTDPPRPPVDQPVTVYHAQPHGNRDPLRHRVVPELFIDVTDLMDEKRAMLAHHTSQKRWLYETQGMGSYLDAMAEICHEIGEISGRFSYAEGWRRRLHYGFCAEDANPLTDALPEGTWHPFVVGDSSP